MLAAVATAERSPLDGNFPHLGYGARAIALGGAYTAVADDLTAIYWNPAGLAQVDAVEILSQRNTLAGGLVNHNVVSVGQIKHGGSKFALSWSRLAPTAQLYSYSEDTVTFGFAKHLGPLDFGISTKLYHSFFESDDEHDTAWGGGFDLGLLFRSRLGSLGIAARDLFSYLNYGDSADKVAVEYSIGYSLTRPTFTFAVALDRQGRDQLLKIGFEQKIFDNVVVRLGRRGESWSGGIGISFQNIKIDYAYRTAPLEGYNIFTYRWSF